MLLLMNTIITIFVIIAILFTVTMIVPAYIMFIKGTYLDATGFISDVFHTIERKEQ